MLFNNTELDSKGQGTIEYVVIVGIVVTLSLIIVAFTTNVFGDVGNIFQGSSRVSTASLGVGIVEGIVDMDGNAVLILQNNSGILITVISIRSGSAPEGDSSFSSIQIFKNEKRAFALVNVDAGCSCSASELNREKTCSFTVSYETEFGVFNSQAADVSVTCVSDAVLVDPLKVAQTTTMQN